MLQLSETESFSMLFFVSVHLLQCNKSSLTKIIITVETTNRLDKIIARETSGDVLDSNEAANIILFVL